MISFSDLGLPLVASLSPAFTRKGVLLCAASLLVALSFLLASLHKSTGLLIASREILHDRGDGLLDSIANSTLGFHKIFVVSLVDRTDRRDAISLAATVTGLDIEFIDAVDHVNPYRLPPGGAAAKDMRDGQWGCWRSHMNIAQRLVREGISTALIMEDDVDWDVRIKSQMQDYARAARLLIQPVKNTPDDHLDPSFPEPLEDMEPVSLHVGGEYENRTLEPSTSPYGDVDRWDMHWVGHCGASFPYVDDYLPLGRAVMLNDATVPAPRHVNTQWGDDQLLEQYPPHTRVVARATGGVCTQAYALSQTGARRVLWELGLRNMTDPVDIELRHMCDGTRGRRRMTCVSPLPALFQQHQPAGDRAHISSIDDGRLKGYNVRASTPNVRLSTILNLEKLVNGESNLTDQYPDSEEDDRWYGDEWDGDGWYEDDKYVHDEHDSDGFEQFEHQGDNHDEGTTIGTARHMSADLGTTKTTAAASMEATALSISSESFSGGEAT